MTWAVTAATVGQIGGSLLGGASARKQAEAQARALGEAKGATTSAYQTSKGYYDPYYQTGTAASNRLAALLGVGGDTGAKDYGYLTQELTPDKLQFDPGYLFRLKEGMKAFEGAAGARGGLLSGATIRGGQQRAQNLASEEYTNAYARQRQRQQDIYNMLYQQQGRGYQAGGDLANLSTDYGANMADYAMKQGGIEAAKTAAKYSMYGDILKSGANFGGSVAGKGGFGKFFSQTPTTTPTQTGNVMGQVNAFNFNNPFQGMDPYKMY